MRALVIGDRVKCIDTDAQRGFREGVFYPDSTVGKVYQVIGIYPANSTIIELEGEYGWFKLDGFEYYDEFLEQVKLATDEL